MQQAADTRKHQEAKAQAASRKDKGKAKDKSPRKKSNPWKLEKLEAKIMKLEGKLEKLNETLTNEEVYSNVDKLRDTQYRIAEVEMELQQANEEWESFA